MFTLDTFHLFTDHVCGEFIWQFKGKFRLPIFRLFCTFVFSSDRSKMEFLGARYFQRNKVTNYYGCKWYYPLVKQSSITGYRLFRTEARTRFFNAAPELTAKTILERIRKEWKRMPADRRDYYRRRELSEQLPIRRCAGVLSFQKGTERKVSNLIGYTDHSSWLVSKAYGFDCNKVVSKNER